MGSKFESLKGTVLEYSESDCWEGAVVEWEITRCHIDDDMRGVCICGQEDLRYCYTIQNQLNGHILYPIGSSCILKFERSELKQIIRIYDQLFHIRTKFYNHEKITLPDFSRALLKFFLAADVFQESTYNNYNSKNDYNFLLKMFNRRSEPTPRQQAKINAIIINSIIPFIKTMER